MLSRIGKFWFVTFLYGIANGHFWNTNLISWSFWRVVPRNNIRTFTTCGGTHLLPYQQNPTVEFTIASNEMVHSSNASSFRDVTLDVTLLRFTRNCVFLVLYIHAHTHTHTHTYIYIYTYIYRVSQEECARLREGVPYVKVYRYNPKHLCPKLNGYGDNGQRSLKLWHLLHTYWLPNTY